MTCKLETIDRENALLFLGIKGKIPEEITALFEKYEPLLLEKIAPRYVYKVVENCAFLQGNDIKKHLENCGKIILLAVTIGLLADEFIRITQASDTAGAVVSDALASSAAEQVCDIAEREIKKKYGRITARFSPGYGDFPLTVQKDLLGLLNAGKQIGLYANRMDLLNPRKSITAVIGIL